MPLSFRICCFFLVFLACHRGVAVESSGVVAYFSSSPVTDTLHVEISREEGAAIPGDTIPNRLFFTSLSPKFLKGIDYLADSAQALVLARQSFRIDDRFTACWVEIRQFWFQHHSLLLYDRHRKTFIDRITLAEWYGGESGQVLVGSRLFDFNGDGKKDILRHEIQHSMIATNDEPQEHLSEGITLLLWEKNRFREAPVVDTAMLIKRFGIQKPW